MQQIGILQQELHQVIDTLCIVPLTKVVFSSSVERVIIHKKRKERVWIMNAQTVTYHPVDTPYPRGITLDSQRTKIPEQAFWMKPTSTGWIFSMHLVNPLQQVENFVADKGKDFFVDALCDKIRNNQDSSPYGFTIFTTREQQVLSLLLQEAERKVISVDIPLDAEFLVNGDVVIYETVFLNEKRVTFQGFADTMQDQTIFSEVAQDVTRLASALCAYRIDRGAWVASENIRAFDNFLEGSSGKNSVDLAKAVVEELSVFINTTLSVYCTEYNVPIIYRNAGKVEKKVFGFNISIQQSSKSFLEKLRDAVLGYTFYKSVEHMCILLEKDVYSKIEGVPAFFSVSPLGHYRLAVREYAWFTTPIRTIVGLLNIVNLAMFLRGEEYFLSDNDIGRIVNELNRS
ncbi:MAG: hypothetical protein CL685_00265 [Candidatus Magasanikbacteria bacterium]|nr:hypothetical protein [Candidatus Magasanikbacteria bacterium]|tara:strand:+ start:8942 stop:10144 length:1203 start_codon:yes stop_codon:yes gene_type:complete